MQNNLAISKLNLMKYHSDDLLSCLLDCSAYYYYRENMIFRQAKKSVAEFLGVAGDNSEEWKIKQANLQRRSLALNQQGRLLTKAGQDQRGRPSRLSELTKTLFLTRFK